MRKTDPQEREQRLFEIADGQGGYFTAKQAIQAGYSYRLQSHHADRGNWLRTERGIYRLRNYPDSSHEDLIRWSLWSHNRQGEPQAVFSHDTALAIHELGDVMPARIHFSVPPTFRKPVPGGCVVHRAQLPTHDIERSDGFLLTSPLRTLVDVAEEGGMDQEHLLRCTTDAVRKGRVTMSELKGRAKTKRLKDIIAHLASRSEELLGERPWTR